MKIFIIEHKIRAALAVLSGTLLALSFPKFNIAGLAWIAPAVLLLATFGAPGRLQFRIGMLAGVTHYLISLYWLLLIPVKFLPILGWLALACYLALYPAAWAWLAWKIFPARIPEADSPFDLLLGRRLRSSSCACRALWCLKCAAIWTALEIVLGRFLSGFPWDFLGVSQYRILPVIQISAWTGVYGVSFLIIWFSSALLLAAFAVTEYPVRRNAWAKEIALPFTALIAVSMFGLSAMRQQHHITESVRIALIQPSIPQTLIWDERENGRRFQHLLSLSKKALEEKPDIIVWPEASVPNMIRHHDETGTALRELVSRSNVWAIVGSDDAEYRPGGATLRDIDYFNSAFLIAPDGRMAAMYRKRQLVIFGEYVPFVKWLPFLKYLSPAGEIGFTPGKDPASFELDSLRVKTAALICFEDTFPDLVREYVHPDTDFLVNLTNNGWFGESAAQWQHAATAVFRAIENRTPLVRCANNGLSCWVDETGRMHDVYFPGSSDIYRAGYKIVTVPKLARDRALTFYTRHGDAFGWTCFWCTALLAALIFYRNRKLRAADSAARVPN